MIAPLKSVCRKLNLEVFVLVRRIHFLAQYVDLSEKIFFIFVECSSSQAAAERQPS